MDFEGRNPLDCDFDGIKQLMLQLFLNGKVNLNELSELIIGQSTIGSVLSQCLDEPAVPEPKTAKMDDQEEDQQEEDDDEDDDNMIFGVTSVVNLSNPDEKECVKQLRNYFLAKSLESGDKEAAAKLKELLEDSSARPTGFIINERFINIPAQIAVPMLENLQKEMKRAADKKMPYKFTQYLMLVKFHRSEKKAAKKSEKKGNNKPPVIHYSNPEEEIFDKDLLLSYEFSVASDADTGLTGNWLEGDTALTPYRRVIVFEEKNLSKMIEQVKEMLK